MQTQRVNISLPHDLLKQLQSEVPQGKRSKFIANAVSEKLMQRKESKKLKKELIKRLEANREYYEKVSREIEEDFTYADAEVLKRLS